MAKPALVVFDMAGTTIEDSGQVPEAFTYVLGTHGIAISEAEPPDLIFMAMERTGVADARSVMAVGDTVLDLRAGRNAGAGWVVGVLSGAHGRAQLEAEPHDALIGSVAELPALLEVHPTA